MERKSYIAAFKTKIVLELLHGEREMNEIAAENKIAPNQLRNWKAEFLDNADIVFDRKRDKRMREELDAKQRESDQLAKKVGQLTLQVDFLKKHWNRKNTIKKTKSQCCSHDASFHF